MKLACLCVVLATGCIQVVGGDDTTGDDTPCTGDACDPGSGGGGSGSGGGAACELVADEGPGGRLAAYELGAQSEWLLTRADDGRATLWEYTGTSWAMKPLGAACLDGLLATSPGGAAAVVCLVRSGGTKDLTLFELGAQVTPTVIMEGELSGQDSVVGVPLAFAYDASERPSVLWSTAIDSAGGGADLYGGFLSRKGPGELTDTFYQRSFAGEHRLVAYGGELLVVEHTPERAISLLHSASLTAMAELDVNASAFELVADADGVHVVVADADTGAVRYFRRGDGAQVASTIATGGGGVSISLDGQGVPVVSYQASDAVQLARRSGTTWAATELVGGGVGSRSIVRVMAADGTLRIAYQDDALDQVVVLREVCP